LGGAEGSGSWVLSAAALSKVKFMKSKPGAAMVEMADGYAVDRAITHLNNNFMFGQKMNVW
jgi:heterogeneous nuclear ribonucleoprotein L